MIYRLKQRWTAESGYREVLKIAFPLILSTASVSLQHFIDRVFLTWYSAEAIAASMPASLMSWTVICLFMGTAAYSGTFVAQYYGAKRMERIGPAVWQGIYIAVAMAVVALLCYPLADPVFALVGHAEGVQQMEVVYFKILLAGTPFIVISNAITGFFSGLGRTWTVMWINVIGTAVNLLLDYLLIFGYYGFPEMGIAGAAWATNAAQAGMAVLFFVLMIRPAYNREYHTLQGWRFEASLFRRLLRYGLPSGWQYLLEVFAFTAFIFMVGNIGLIELAASNIAFNINMLAFMPMFGLSAAVSILVGQHLGENRPDLAEKATWSAYHMAFGFFSILGISYYMVPDLFIWPFAAQAEGGDFTPIQLLAANLLKFVAFYCLFDAGVMVFSGALKGAGDTRFVAIASISLSWSGMMLPSLLLLHYRQSIYWFWVTVTFYVTTLCLAFLWRFLRGRWKSMRVIEEAPPDLAVENSGAAGLAEAPVLLAEASNSLAAGE